jgi:hypothetical protein
MPASKINAFASLPFDRLDSIYAINLKDDFVNALGVADADPDVALSSELQWLIDLIAGDSVPHVDIVASVAKHPGIISLETGATTAADGDAAGLVLAATAGADTIILDTNGIYVASILRVPDIDGQKVEFGLFAAAGLPNSSAADVVSLVLDFEDAASASGTKWIAQVNAAGVDTETVMNVVYDQNDWVLLEVAASSTGATFRVTTDNGSVTNSINGTMPIVGLVAGFSTETLGAAEEVLEIDAFQLRYLRRTPSAVVGA